jgi:hypothetical protein
MAEDVDVCWELSQCIRYYDPINPIRSNQEMNTSRLMNLLLQMQERSREGLMISPLIDEALAILEGTVGHSHVVRDGPNPTANPPMNTKSIPGNVLAVHRAIEASNRSLVSPFGPQPYPAAFDYD